MARKKEFDYDAYKKWYYKQEMVNARAGKPMYIRMYTYQEAKDVYEYTKQDLKDDVRKGKRGTIGNVYQYMAREQQGEISYARAKALYRMAKETGQDVSFKDVRYASQDELKSLLNWDEVKNKKQQLLSMGFDLTWANNYISYYYFGSE